MKKKVLLFVCKGNRYRSRIAEEIFNKNAPHGFIAKSAGIHYQKWNDRAVPKVLREIGIELTKRKPMKLTGQMIAKASRVIVFDGVKISGKMETWPVKDCHAGDVVCIRKGRKQIERRVKKLLTELVAYQK
ncbi:MAG: low molecular weight phosphatase family protein [Candidatus Aenigmarchaeota archaeon]|nr:low molecular weight phosphatase family protein [Candidatus Aenigmarchaeota archaeon]